MAAVVSAVYFKHFCVQKDHTVPFGEHFDYTIRRDNEKKTSMRAVYFRQSFKINK